MGGRRSARGGRGRRGRADRGARPVGANVVVGGRTRRSRSRWSCGQRLAPDRLGLLPLTVGIAVAEAVEELTSLAVSLKWPNDITYGGRKLAGILVETRVEGQTVAAVVAGVGVNVGWESDEVPEEIAEPGLEPSDRARGRASLASGVDRFDPVLVRAALRLRRRPSRGIDEVLARATARSELLGETVVIRNADGVRVHRPGRPACFRRARSRSSSAGTLDRWKPARSSGSDGEANP